MDILNKAPVTWQELQSSVADILEHCGYEVTVEEDVKTVRGKVNLDVLAIRKTGYQNTVICECKNWGNNIPQYVIHSFRTVVGDLGASHGFIIAKKGFQKGAYDAAKGANISILTWEEFMGAFTEEWLSFVVDRNVKLGKALQSFGGWLLTNGAKVLQEKYAENEQLFLSYRNNYEDLIFFSFEENYKTLMGNKISREEIDKRVSRFSKDIPMRVDSYTDYFDYIYSALASAIAGVEKIFGNLIKWEDIVKNEQGN